MAVSNSVRAEDRNELCSFRQAMDPVPFSCPTSALCEVLDDLNILCFTPDENECESLPAP
jgi:hypothetical protein